MQKAIKNNQEKLQTPWPESQTGESPNGVCMFFEGKQKMQTPWPQNLLMLLHA